MASTAKSGVPVRIEIVHDGVLIHELDVPRKAVADYLREVPVLERGGALVHALEVGVFCLERASGARDLDFVRKQVEALLTGVDRTVSGIPEALKGKLIEQLGTDDGQVLAPVQHLVDEVATVLTERLNGVRDLISDKIDPEKRSSTLGQALGALKDLLDPGRSDSIQSVLEEAVVDVASENGALVASVKVTVTEAMKPLADEVNRLGKQIAASDAAEEALRHTTKKGTPFEEQVVVDLQARASSIGAQVTHVGADNQPGDILIDFPESGVSGDAPTVAVEARDRTTPMGRKAIAETLDRAIAHRGAGAAIYVSRTRDGLAKEIGDWAEGTCERGPWIATTPEHLHTAIRFLLAQHRLAVMHDALPDVDRAAIEAQIQRIRTSLKRVTNINRSIGEIRDHAGAVQDEAEQLRGDIRDALGCVEELLRAVTDTASAA